MPYYNNNAIIHYGIPIPMDNSDLYKYVLKQLISKHEHLYTIDCKEDTGDFLIDLSLQENINVSFDVENIEFINLNYDYRPIYVNNILTLSGNHNAPNLYSTPFKSKADCIKYYEQEFGDILPTDFDYENNIGIIYYVS